MPDFFLVLRGRWLLFWRDARWPRGAAESTMVEARAILVAGKIAIAAKGSFVEPVAVTVEVIFGKVFVVFDAVVGRDGTSFGPGERLDFYKFDIGGKIVLFDQIMTEFM